MTIHGSTREHVRKVKEIPRSHSARRRRCRVAGGCTQKCTHYGVVVNDEGTSVCMTARCEFHAYAWVRDGR